MRVLLCYIYFKQDLPVNFGAQQSQNQAERTYEHLVQPSQGARVIPSCKYKLLTRMQVLYCSLKWLAHIRLEQLVLHRAVDTNSPSNPTD